MELQSKHLLPYLIKGRLLMLHKGKVVLFYGFNHAWGSGGPEISYLSNPKVRGNGISGWCTSKSQKLYYAGYLQFKPLLRPMTDFFKTIKIEDRQFIPFEELQKISDGSVAMDDFIAHLDDFQDIIGQVDFNQCPHMFREKLIEWQFDIEGLISAGLAVNYNTIKK